MNETKQNEKEKQIIILDNIKYSINEDQKTVSVIGSESSIKRIFIPSSINYESKEYEVTSISKDAFNLSTIKSIEFPTDSKIRTIEDFAFSYSSIESLTIPSLVFIL